MRYASIYLIINKINNKKYIGQTIFCVEDRWKAHIRSKNSNAPLHLAFKKYGVENFSFIELCSTTSEENTNYLEEYFIKYYKCYGNKGYNRTYGGDASSGKFTEEVRLKMRLAKLGKPGNNRKGNQSGSTEDKKSGHAQRLEDETTNVEYNSSTSFRQPSKFEINKDKIIEIYLKSNSTYKVKEELDLEVTSVKNYLRKWGVLKSQSEAASQRNKNRYKVNDELKNKIVETYQILKSGNKTAKELNVPEKTVYRVLKAEKIV